MTNKIALKGKRHGFQERLVRMTDTLKPRSRRTALGYAFLLNCVIGYIDYATGYDIGISVFYLAPIGIVMWLVNEKRSTGIFMSLTTSMTLTLSNILAGKEVHSYVIEIWNTLVHFLFFSISALLIYEVKSNLRKRSHLIAELQQALNEVKALSGLLPMCSSCKKIRDDKGYWNQVESYIGTHLQAEISHGLCPECAEKLYPDIYQKREREKVMSPGSL
jgi:hypothetical protein